MLKNKNIAILFFTLIVVMLGFGMIIPVPHINSPFMTGALVMPIGFVASMFYLSSQTSPVENPVRAD